MKNINIGIVFDQVVAKCDFCGEDNKNCFRSSVTNKSRAIRVPETKYKSFYSIDEIIVGHKFIDGDPVDICEDCIKQLTKFIKKKKHEFE